MKFSKSQTLQCKQWCFRLPYTFGYSSTEKFNLVHQKLQIRTRCPWWPCTKTGSCVGLSDGIEISIWWNKSILPERNVCFFCFWMDLISLFFFFFFYRSSVSGIYKQQENSRQRDKSTRKEKERQVNSCILIALLKDASPWKWITRQ